MNNNSIIFKSSKVKVLGIGLSCLDIIKLNDSIYYYGGGSCGNVVSALSALGWDSDLIIRKYDDFAGKLLESNIDIVGVKRILVGNSNSKTPTIIENLLLTNNQYCRHSFLLTCPVCGCDLPRLKPFTINDIDALNIHDSEYNVFYTDRISPGIKFLRDKVYAGGAWTVFESNSSRNIESFFSNALNFSIVKFSAEKISLSISDKLKAISENSKVLLIVQTLGKDGLRFCYRKKDKKISAWIYLPAKNVSSLIDTAGAGDWCTSGMLASLVPLYAKRPSYITKENVINSLQFGQSLSAISCSFVGGQGLLFSGNAFKHVNVYDINGLKIPKFPQVMAAKPTSNQLSNACSLCLQLS